jgi:hypothetical protein
MAAAAVTHAFTNPQSDGPDTTITRPSNWNANHVTATRTRNFPISIQGAGVQGTPAYATVGGNGRYAAWALDAASSEYVVLSVVIPEDFSSGNFTVKLYWTNLGAGAGNVVWNVIMKTLVDTTDLDSTTSETNANSTIAAPAQNILKVSTHGIAVAGAAGGLFRLLVGRVGADGADTLANDAGLVAVEVEYTADS